MRQIVVDGALRAGAGLYGAVVALRNRLYDDGVLTIYRSELPVVSLGNISAGGSGKTPLALWLAKELKGRGRSPVILSRGYRGEEAGPLRVTADHTPSLVGDEPFLMASSGIAPVYISRDRAEGAKLIESDGAGDIILLDDGFQHRALYRDFDLITIDVSSTQACARFIGAELLPFGMMREGRESALRRASAVVLNFRGPRRQDEAIAHVRLKIPSELPIYECTYSAPEILSRTDGSPLAVGQCHLACGIANPEGFISTVRSLGFAVISVLAVRDHHPLDPAKLERLLAEKGNAPIIITEKDAVKLPRDLGLPIYVLSVKPEVTKEGELLQRILCATQ